MSKPELLRYVELELWSRFSAKLWRGFGLVVAVAAVAGLLGVPYYIRSELSSHLMEVQNTFAKRTEILLQYGKLLSLLSTTYSVKKLELTQQVVLTNQAIDSLLARQIDEELRGQLKGARDYLTQAAWWEEYAHPEVSPRDLIAISLPRTDMYREVKILPHKRITAEERIGGMMVAGTSFPHAVNDGTLRGVMMDTKFRVAHLLAYRLALKDLRGKIVEYDDDASKPEQELNIAIIYNEEFQPAYEGHLDKVASELLVRGEREKFEQYGYLYKIQNEIPAVRVKVD